MLVDLNLIEAKILYHGELTECGISIDNGKIVKVGRVVTLPKASETISAEGNLVLPGLIDVHVHLRDLGLSHKEDFFSGTCAAAVGGFTTVLDMPNTQPLTKNPRALEEKIFRARGLIVTNVGFYGSLPSRWEEFEEMEKLGMVAFKVNLMNPITDLNVDDDDILLRALRTAARIGQLMAFHAEDRRIVEPLARKLQKAGDTSLSAFLRAHCPEAEEKAVERIIRLNEEAGARIHISHLTTAKALALIRKAKRGGMKVTCEVTPHHLLLSDKDLFRIGTTALTYPPLRQSSDVLQLWSGLSDGTINIVATDHAPHLLSEKMETNVWKVPKGVPGLETALPLLMNKVNQGEMTLSRFIEVFCESPSRIFELRGKGAIERGYDADLIIVDRKRKFRINSADFQSKAKYSPFDGCEVSGKVIKTFVMGKLIAEEGEIVAEPGSGQICLKRTEKKLSL